MSGSSINPAGGRRLSVSDPGPSLPTEPAPVAQPAGRRSQSRQAAPDMPSNTPAPTSGAPQSMPPQSNGALANLQKLGGKAVDAAVATGSYLWNTQLGTKAAAVGSVGLAVMTPLAKHALDSVAHTTIIEGTPEDTTNQRGVGLAVGAAVAGAMVVGGAVATVRGWYKQANPPRRDVELGDVGGNPEPVPPYIADAAEDPGEVPR